MIRLFFIMLLVFCIYAFLNIATHSRGQVTKAASDIPVKLSSVVQTVESAIQDRLNK